MSCKSRILFIKMLKGPTAQFPQMELPHHSRQEPAGPIGPQLAAMMPLSFRGVDREEVGIYGDESCDLLLGKVESGRVSGCAGGGHPPNVG